MPGPFLLFRNLLIQTRPHWDRSETRPAVRSAFAKALQCRTPELGAEVFASDNEEQGGASVYLDLDGDSSQHDYDVWYDKMNLTATP